MIRNLLVYLVLGPELTERMNQVAAILEHAVIVSCKEMIRCCVRDVLLQSAGGRQESRFSFW